MPVISITNNTAIDQAYLDCNNNPVIIAPGNTATFEVETHMPAETTKLSIVTDYDGAGNILYRGYALPNTALNAKGWAIFKRVALGGNDSIDRWVNGENPPKMKYEWDQRTTFTYS